MAPENDHLSLQRVVPPIFQALVALTVGILLGLFLLSQVTFAVRDDLTHVSKVVLVILVGILGWILFQNLDDVAAGVMTDSLTAVVFTPT